MNDRECVALLQWALPRLGLRWEGFRGLRRQVCRRITARMRTIGVSDPVAYRALVDSDPEERRIFDALCHVTISRFYRDRRIFDALRDVVLVELAETAIARGDRALHVWSAGCASGEEPYTIAVAWHLELAGRYPGLELDVLATDYDDEVLARAARGSYPESSLREIPPRWRDAAFALDDDGCLSVRPEMRRGVTFRHEDIRIFTPPAPVHLVACRNAAFTYWGEEGQRDFLRRIEGCLVPGGLLVVGAHEAIPEGTAFRPPTPCHLDARGIYVLSR